MVHCGARLRSVLCFQGAPAWWLVSKSRRAASVLLMLATPLLFLDSARSLFDAKYVAAGIGFFHTLIGACLCFVLSPKNLSTRQFQIAVFGWLVFTNAAVLLRLYEAPELIYRTRLIVVCAFASKITAVVLGLPLASTCAFVFYSYVLDTAAIHYARTYYGDSLSLGVDLTNVLLLAGFLANVLYHHVKLQALYDTEQQLIAEKEAVESLLSMVSDAAVWLGADGDSLLRSDGRFDELIGRNMKGGMLSDCFPQDFTEAERQRLRRAFSLDSCSAMKEPPRLIPTTLSCHPNVRINVDLFIVDRRTAMVNINRDGDPIAKLGFLVGIRITSKGDPLFERYLEAEQCSNARPSENMGFRLQEMPTVAQEGADMTSVPDDLSHHPQSSFSANSLTRGTSLDQGLVIPCGYEVLVQEAQGQLMPRAAESVKAGDTVYCVDVASCTPCFAIIGEIRPVASRPWYTVTVCPECCDEHFEVRVLDRWDLLFDIAGCLTWRSAQRIGRDVRYTLPVMDHETAGTGFSAWQHRVISVSGVQSKQLSMLRLQLHQASLALFVRDAFGVEYDVPFVAVAMRSPRQAHSKLVRCADSSDAFPIAHL